ncbi:hypothetical protein B0A55_09092, partial [Friedmanniomyces simplex]
MAKRKASTRAQEPTGPDMDVGTSRKRIHTYEDVADSDDEFHLQRDEVLLREEPGAKRRRKLQEEEDFLQPSDDEVLDHSEPEDEEDDEDEAGLEDQHVAARGQGAKGAESDQDSDHDEEGEEGGWGTTKADLYGADDIETEEQALEEEAEAIRLQKKQLQALSAADYGFDEADWQSAGKLGEDTADEEAVVTEVLPQLHVTPDMSAAERLKLLKSRYPEFEPLRKELLQLQDTHAALAKEVKAASSSDAPSNTVTKLRAASAYLGALTMYFSLLTSTASRGEAGAIAMSATRLRDHPVMDSLVQ